MLEGWKGSLLIIYSNSPAQSSNTKITLPSACLNKFWVSLRMEIPQSLWATVQYLTILTVKSFFLVFKMNFLHFNFCLSSVVRSLESMEKSLSLPHIRYFLHEYGSPSVFQIIPQDYYPQNPFSVSFQCLLQGAKYCFFIAKGASDL